MTLETWNNPHTMESVTTCRPGQNGPENNKKTKKVQLTTKGVKNAGFQQDRKLPVHQIPSLSSARALTTPAAKAAGQRWAHRS